LAEIARDQNALISSRNGDKLIPAFLCPRLSKSVSFESMSLRPFHLAIPVRDILEARAFYGTFLGFEEGRSATHWIDWNFFGHQLVTHEDQNHARHLSFNAVDGDSVPIPHFGVVLEMTDWKSLQIKLENSDVKFIIEPHIRFEGQPGEQATMFFLDPSGNALEFKAFENLGQLFAK